MSEMVQHMKIASGLEHEEKQNKTHVTFYVKHQVSVGQVEVWCCRSVEPHTAHAYIYVLWTYRECVCAIVLPHLQQGHHHFMEFISRQNPITVHIEHFEANWQ